MDLYISPFGKWVRNMFILGRTVILWILWIIFYETGYSVGAKCGQRNAMNAEKQNTSGLWKSQMVSVIFIHYSSTVYSYTIDSSNISLSAAF